MFTSILFNQHYEFSEQIMGDGGTLEITIGKGLYYREPEQKASMGASRENWWAGATVSEHAVQQGFPIFPEKGGVPEGFLDRELVYAKRFLAAHGVYDYREPNDPWYEEMVNFFASIREGKPVAAGLEIGAADSLGVIYANRAIETQTKVFWPAKTQYCFSELC